MHPKEHKAVNGYRWQTIGDPGPRRTSTPQIYQLPDYLLPPQNYRCRCLLYRGSWSHVELSVSAYERRLRIREFRIAAAAFILIAGALALFVVEWLGLWTP